jgi:micrococcal nuclease
MGWNAAQSGAMSSLRVRSIFAVVAVSLVGAASAGELCTAIDGATLQCGRDRVRVEGLRAPGLREPGEQEARQRLQRRIQSGELVIERKGRDKYGRTLGRAYVNGNRITQLDVSPPSGRGHRRP